MSLYDVVLEEDGTDFVLEQGITEREAEDYLTRYGNEDTYIRESKYKGEEL